MQEDHGFQPHPAVTAFPRPCSPGGKRRGSGVPAKEDCSAPPGHSIFLLGPSHPQSAHQLSRPPQAPAAHPRAPRPSLEVAACSHALSLASCSGPSHVQRRPRTGRGWGGYCVCRPRRQGRRRLGTRRLDAGAVGRLIHGGKRGGCATVLGRAGGRSCAAASRRCCGFCVPDAAPASAVHAAEPP